MASVNTELKTGVAQAAPRRHTPGQSANVRQDATAKQARTAVTVIVCTWNRSALLAQTLASLQEQTGVDRDAVEVIVVDNNSVDDTRALVERLAATWTLGALRCAFEPRQGKQFALNRAIELAQGSVLAFTDDDILFPGDWLQQIERVFADPAVELAGGKTLVSWPPSGRPAWYADEMRAVLAGVDLGDERLDPVPTDYAPGGSNLIARRALFERVGQFSEIHFRHMDYEFGLRCNSLGTRVVYEPAIVVRAPVDSRCLTRRYFRRWAFKAGIARSGGMEAVGVRFPAVSRWIFRQLIEDFFRRWRWSRRVSMSSAFAHEMRMWRALGTICNAWHAWLAPSRHFAWVERHSQKKNGLY